jgi:hypothetical protein
MPRRKIGAIENGKYVSYDESTSNGDAVFVEMARERRAPGLKGTDTQNFRGIANADPFINTRGNDSKKLWAQAKAMGINPEGKRYMAGLVRDEYRGRFDPEALVDSVHDVKRILETRGWGTHEDSDSMVKVKAREVEADDPLDQKYTPDTNLVHEHVQRDLEHAGVDRIGKKEYATLVENKTTQLAGEQ